MTTFYRYPLPVNKAIEHYTQKHGQRPATIVTNHTALNAVNLGISQINLGISQKITVTTSGGCLANEIWLALPKQQTNGGGSAPAQLAIF